MGVNYFLGAKTLTRQHLSATALVMVLAAAVSTFLVSPSTALAANHPAPVQRSTLRATTTDSSADTATLSGGLPRAQAIACGGVLIFGEVVVCPSITEGEEHVFAVTTTKDSDRLFITRTRGSGGFVSAGLLGPDGTFLCAVVDATECQLGAAGTYTVTLSLLFGGTGDYTLAVDSMRTPSSCTDLPSSFFSFASPGLTATLPLGAAARCYRFLQPVGSVLHLADPGGAGDVQGMIRDGKFQPLCPVRDTNRCTLTGPGPYRLFLAEAFGTEVTYKLRMPRISNSAGCPAVKLASFGDPEAAVGNDILTEFNEVTCHKLRSEEAGTVAVRISPDQHLFWTVFTNAGEAICDKFSNRRSCLLPEPGNYTLVTQNQSFFGDPVVYQVAVAALFHSTGCAATTGTTWDLPTLLVHQTSPVQTNCQPFEGSTAERIVAYRAPIEFNDVAAWLVDSTGRTLCDSPSNEVGCVLPAGGTYRVISYLQSWSADSTDEIYKLQVRRLSEPVGCTTVQPGTFGASPAGAPGGIRCRILDIPAAGGYLLKNVDAENFEIFGDLFDSTGLRLDACGVFACTFTAAGRYTMVLNGASVDSVIDNDFQYAVALLRAAPSAGCVAVSDTGYQDAPHRGRFLTAGQHDCLQLPSPAGARVVELLPGDALGAGAPTVLVFDATGAFLCDSSFQLRQSSCELAGTAPFIAVLSTRGGQPTGSYAMAFARVDGPPACPVLSADETGATVTTGPDRFAVCFSIPADQHATTESFQYRRTSGTGRARLSVFDGTGLRFCGPSSPSADRTITCFLPEGPATAILETDAVTATYQLTHSAVP